MGSKGDKFVFAKPYEKNHSETGNMRKLAVIHNFKKGGAVGDFMFEIPPEAPVFEPTREEFEEPLKYINAIRHIAEKSGICKIKPPSSHSGMGSMRKRAVIRNYKKGGAIGDFKFEVPLEAPVFEPTKEEFEDPLKYINSIRHIAEKFGLCKIKPPSDWQPPFTVDVDKFKFTPRIQRLNELEAKTRIKLNFLDQIAKFWELQGSCLKIPVVEKKVLDLYTLYRAVQEEGGFHTLSLEKKWPKVSQKMGFSNSKGLGVLLKNHYERILYPYDIFSSGEVLAQVKMQPEIDDLEKRDCDYKPHGIPSRQAIKPPHEKYGRRSKRYDPAELDDIEGQMKARNEWNDNKELRRLQFYGAGPKMAGFQNKKPEKPKSKGKRKKAKREYDPLAKYVCHYCSRGDVEDCMLLCDGCDDSYHTFCLMPPLEDIPKGDWRCPVCVAEEVSKPTEAFGFEQAQREYTLQQFGEMADIFKSHYFNMPVHCVPPSMVEREFWRIVSSIDEDVTVEYGADLHTMDHGSGFPTKCSVPPLIPVDEVYTNSGWNLNNLPVLEGSVLGHINADISGMKVPWMYVGMCFATFCWHNEDHWSYSINYLHWGEPKTWYGVPGSKAECFEAAMKKAAPELFHSQPDLLHQLVTIMNPNILMNEGVPVCRTDQQAGEFVVTFPRAYHAGFNQGYNFAEAVNFAPADWLKIGRECVNHYSILHRFCVFSHDELVCKMALDPHTLDSTVATATYHDMQQMFEEEKSTRKALLEWGICEAEREAFELLPDDERQCEICKTTCFLSAVICVCNADKLVCLRHFKDLCSCAPEKHSLRYRYTMDELGSMLHKLKIRSDSFEVWITNVDKCFDTKLPKTELSVFKALFEESIEKKFPQNSKVTEVLSRVVSEGEQCAKLAQELCFNKVLTRTRPKPKVTLEELRGFSNTIERLACALKEGSAVKELVEKVESFKKKSEALLKDDLPSSKELGVCLEAGLDLVIDLPEVPKLQQYYEQMQWVEEVQHSRAEPEQLTVDVLRKLLSTGLELPPHSAVERSMTELQTLLSQVERWEEKAKLNLQARSLMSLDEIESFLKEAANIPAFLPSRTDLENALEKGKEWMSKVEAMQGGENFPYIDTQEEQVNKGRNVLARLDPLPELEDHLSAAKAWKERAARTFLRKNSHYTLMDALSPRTAWGLEGLKLKNRRYREENSERRRVSHMIHKTKLEGDVDPATVVAAFKSAEIEEISNIVVLRIQNEKKRANDSGGEARYCICRRGISGSMLQCELCKDLFHSKCMPNPKTYNNKSKLPSSAQQLVSSSFYDHKFLCPCCLKSRRPRLETILSLLVLLQKLPVRIPEGEALQCLTERAMNWQDRARTLLADKEVASVLAKLSVLSQKLIEIAAREKTEKIITSELKKAAGNPELHRRVQTMTSLRGPSEESQGSQPSPTREGENCSKRKDPSEEFLEQSTLIARSCYSPLDDDLVELLRHDEDDEPHYEMSATSFNNLEHAYSAASKMVAVGCKKHVRKTPLVPRQLECPVLRLSGATQLLMEELMMEGDLLEVSLDETHHMWRILQAVRPREEHKYPDFEEWENEIIWYSEDGKEKRKAKKKTTPDDPETSGLTKRIRVRIADEEDEKLNSKRKDKKKSKDTKEPPKRVRKLKGKGEDGRKKGVRSRVSKLKQDTSEDEEDCAAYTCLRPTGHEVDWVQCDGGCDMWFHLHCVGLIKADINEQDDYVCTRCSDNHDNQTKYIEEEIHLSPLKLEITHEDESMGLDALLSLSMTSPDWDSSCPTAVYEDSQNIPTIKTNSSLCLDGQSTSTETEIDSQSSSLPRALDE